MKQTVNFRAFGIPPALWLVAERSKAGVVRVGTGVCKAVCRKVNWC